MDWRSFCLAIAVHGLLVIMLVFGLNWKTESSGPLQVELWAAGNSPVSPPPAQSKPEPPPPPKPEPKPCKRCGAIIKRQIGQINIHRQPGHVADKQVDGRAALESETLLFCHMGQNL